MSTYIEDTNFRLDRTFDGVSFTDGYTSFHLSAGIRELALAVNAALEEYLEEDSEDDQPTKMSENEWAFWDDPTIRTATVLDDEVNREVIAVKLTDYQAVIPGFDYNSTVHGDGKEDIVAPIYGPGDLTNWDIILSLPKKEDK